MTAGCEQFPYSVPSTQDASLSSSLPTSVTRSHHFIFKGQWFLFKIIILFNLLIFETVYFVIQTEFFLETQYIKVKE